MICDPEKYDEKTLNSFLEKNNIDLVFDSENGALHVVLVGAFYWALCNGKSAYVEEFNKYFEKEEQDIISKWEKVEKLRKIEEQLAKEKKI